MKVLRLATAALLAAALGAAGCSKSGTVLGAGPMDRSVRLIKVPSGLEVVNLPELRVAGASTLAEVQVRNRSARKKMWHLEYKFQFYTAENRELESTARGWQPLTIGRGETRTVKGVCPLPGAQTAVLTFRKWEPGN